jgi:hypothetical protein
MSDFFDDVENESANSNRPEKPIWALNLDDSENEDAILKWLLAEQEYLKQENRDRFQAIQKNLALYKGIQYQSQELRSTSTSQNSKDVVQKIVANQIFDLVQNSVSKLCKYRPGVAILPAEDEFADKIGAEMVDAWLKHIWYTQKFESEIDPQIKKLAKIMGEAYLFVEWDEEAGDMHGEFKKNYLPKLEAGEEVFLLNEAGEKELDDSGNPIRIEAPVYNGDVVYNIRKTTDCLLDRPASGNYSDANYIFWREVMPVELARLKWPKKAEKIKSNKDAVIFDYEKMEVRKTSKSEVVVWSFYHKRTKGCDKGRLIRFTVDGILENGPSKYSHRELCCKRYVDKLMPGELHGVSSIDFVKGLTGAYNNLTNMILRNQVMVAHPKWMLPAGAAKLESLGNDITIVQYKGPVAPQLVSANATPQEVFGFREKLKEEFQQLFGIHGVSRGEPPPGIKSGVALQWLSEQENERQNEDVLFSNEFQRQVAVMTIAVAGDRYDEDDERQVRILGKHGSWKTIFFDVAHLSKAYDVRISNSSALPQSKAARTQTLLDLNEQFPDRVSADLVLDMLDMAQEQKFIDVATVSVRAAEAENEALLTKDANVPPPEEYEDHIAHWKVHARQAREWNFKNMTPKEVQDRLADHIRAHEMLMEQYAKLNPTYVEQLALLQGFPMFFRPSAAVEATEAQPMEDVAGEPMIPGQPGGPIEPEAQLPVNPELGGEPQLDQSPEMPSMDAQLGGTPPVPPSGAV